MKPVDTYLPYGQQWIDEEDIQSVLEVLRSPFLTQGPKVKEFEEKVAGYVNAKYAVSFSNGTAALHGACAALNITAGDEVIVPAITFAATSNAVLYCGATPVFADIDPITYNIDTKKVESLITDKTKAIIPVDFTGKPADLPELQRIAEKHGLHVIVDGAHSLGAKRNGQNVGNAADMTMFSFHPVKPVTTAEGGVITTNSEVFYNKLLKFRSHGIEKTEHSLEQGDWYYEMTSLGYNYRMTDVQAALGISQLNKIDQFVSKRNEIASLYSKYLKNHPLIKLPEVDSTVTSGWHLYMIQLNLNLMSKSRRQVFDEMRASGIGVHVHYIPVYWHPYYQEIGYKKGICPAAEGWYEQALTLPVFPKMTEQDVIRVVTELNRIIQ